MPNKISFSRLQPTETFCSWFSSSCFSPNFPDLFSPRHPPWARRPNFPFYGRSGCLSHICYQGRSGHLGNHIRSALCFHMSDPTIWTPHLFTGIFFIWWYKQKWRKLKKQKLQWQQHRQDNNTLSQAGYTPKHSPKNLQGQGTARLCPCTESL